MRILKIKQSLIVVSLFALALSFIVANPLIFGFCRDVGNWSSGVEYCRSSTFDAIPDWILQLFGFLASCVFLLSLLTYRMREEVFRAWWSFARWWVPVIILATIGVNLYITSEGSGADMFDRAFSVWFLGALYGILILVSLYRIIRTYVALKKG